MKKVLVLSGGVGGAKLALGPYRVLDAGNLVVAVNTGDDFDHLGGAQPARKTSRLPGDGTPCMEGHIGKPNEIVTWFHVL